MKGEPFSVSGDAGRLGGWVTGEGPPVLVLHGGPGMGAEYLDLMVDEIVDAAYRVAVFQQRGLSPSTTEGPFTLARALSDALAVADALGWRRFWLVGHSWGGHLALHLAVAAEERLLGVLSVDPVGALGDGGLERFNQARVARVDLSVRPRLEGVLSELDTHSTTALYRELLDLAWPAYFADPANAPPMGPTRVDARAGDGLGLDMVNAMPALAAALPALRLPMVFVGADGSPIPSEAVRETAALVPGADFVLLRDVGHFMWLEKPGCVAEALDALVGPS